MTAIYCRQSVDKRDSISIETQSAFCSALLAEGESSEIYADRGYSGSNTNRPEFAAMINDIKRGKISRVIVYRLDRISRSLLDFAGIYELFRERGITFNSATEQFDTGTPMGCAMLNILMVFAQLERETICTRIRDNYYERGKKGLFLGGKAPFGFIKVQKIISGVKTCALEEDKARAEAVRRIFDEYYLGSSLGQIAKKFNKTDGEFYKIRPKAGFSAVFLGRMLRNPVYVKANADVYEYLRSRGAVLHNDINEFNGEHGLTVYGCRRNKTAGKLCNLSGENVQLNSHIGLIEAEKWLAVQKKLSENRALKNSGRGKNSFLTGLVKCGCCGRAISAVKNGKKRYLNCGGRKEGVCSARRAVKTFDELENIVRGRLFKYIAEFELITPQENPARKAEENELKAAFAAVSQEIGVIVGRLSQVGQTAVKYLSERLDELEERKNALVGEISRISQISAGKTRRPSREEIKLLSGSSVDFDEQRELAAIFISKVVVFEDEINIHFVL